MTLFYGAINLQGNELQNAVVQVLAQAPTSPAAAAGRLYYLTGTGLQVHTGSAWTTVETQDHKGAASGYAPLNSNSKVPLANLSTGNGSDTLPLLKETIADGYVLAYSSSLGGFIGKSISGIYVYKGSVATYADLPSSGQSVGDTYNVVAAYGDNPPGSNYTWNGTAWDALGGSVDLSAYLLSATAASTYQTLANLTTSLSSASTDAQYPSAKAVYTADQTLNSAITSEASTRASADSALQTAVNLRALDSAVVHLAGAETLTGQKTMPCPTFTGVGPSMVSAIFEGGAEGATLDIEFGLYPLIACRAGGAACPLYIDSSVIYGVTPAATSRTIEVVTAYWVRNYVTSTLGLAGKYSTTLTGDGTTTAFTVTHSLGTKAVAISVYDSSGNEVICNKQVTSTTAATITLTPAPTSSETFTVVVVG